MLSNPNPKHPVEREANEVKKIFLAEMQKCWNVWTACKKLGITRSLIYNDWLAKDSVFKAQYEDILQSHVDRAEGNLMNQAIHNKKNYVPAIFMLKSHRPQVYDRQQDMTISHVLSIDLSEAARTVLAKTKDVLAIEAAEFSVIPPERIGRNEGETRGNTSTGIE